MKAPKLHVILRGLGRLEAGIVRQADRMRRKFDLHFGSYTEFDNLVLFSWAIYHCPKR